MTNMDHDARHSGFAHAMHVLLRVGAALLFMQHGAQKLLGWLGGVSGDGATVPLMSQMGLAGLLELGGGFLILIGLLTRPVAVLLAIEMVAAYVIAHMPQGGFPVQNQGELALLYALVFAHFAGFGAGRLSVDHWLSQRREDREVVRTPVAPEGERRVAEAPRRRSDNAA